VPLFVGVNVIRQSSAESIPANILIDTTTRVQKALVKLQVAFRLYRFSVTINPYGVAFSISDYVHSFVGHLNDP